MGKISKINMLYWENCLMGENILPVEEEKCSKPCYLKCFIISGSKIFTLFCKADKKFSPQF